MQNKLVLFVRLKSEKNDRISEHLAQKKRT